MASKRPRQPDRDHQATPKWHLITITNHGSLVPKRPVQAAIQPCDVRDLPFMNRSRERYHRTSVCFSPKIRGGVAYCVVA
ncbi:MAG: hypothetical protein M1415_05980, partial [Firmicutes bacterium]|nr:hypothetical protein [Bacillota bacterium]